jgi:hypothetical protein
MCIPHTHTNKHEDKQPHLGYSKMGGEVDERARVLVCKPHPASGVARRSYAKHASIPESVVGKVEMARPGKTAIQIQTSTDDSSRHRDRHATDLETEIQHTFRFHRRSLTFSISRALPISCARPLVCLSARRPSVFLYVCLPVCCRLSWSIMRFQ